jgi:hypothetical protein
VEVGARPELPCRRLRDRRFDRRESSVPEPSETEITDAAATDAAQPGTPQGVAQSASVNASSTLPAMSFTLPALWHPQTCTVAYERERAADWTPDADGSGSSSGAPPPPRTK